MPVQNSIYNYSILAAGGTVSLDVRAPYSKYVIGSTTSVVLLADQEFIHTGTPNQGCTFYIEYIGNIVSNYSGGITVSFFGVDLTDAQANSRCDITAYYTAAGTWNVSVRPDFSEQQTNLIIPASLLGGSISTSKIGDNEITLPKIEQLTSQGYMLRSDASNNIEEFSAKTSGNLLLGNGTTINSTAMSGDITINGSGVTTIGANKVLTTMIANNNVTTDKLSTILQTELLVVPVSFEANEQGPYKIRMPYPGTIIEIYTSAIKPIAATDSGTIILKDGSGTTMTVTTPIVFAPSDIFGTVYASAVTANNSFAVFETITINTAKTTAGGKVLVTLRIVRT